jgi:hypothetical protein
LQATIASGLPNSIKRGQGNVHYFLQDKKGNLWLRACEIALPTRLKKAFKNENKLQVILTAKFRGGATGNYILSDALGQAKFDCIAEIIYTSQLDIHGHAAGPTIGLCDFQGGVRGGGDYPLYPNTAYSTELNAATEIPEWKKSVRILLEEDGFWDEKVFWFICGRQAEIYLIPRKNSILGE